MEEALPVGATFLVIVAVWLWRASRNRGTIEQRNDYRDW